MKTNDVLKGLGVVGAAVAAYFLFEPRAGSKRRKKIATMSRDIYSGAGEELGRLGGEITRLSGDVGRGLTGVVDRVGELTGLSSGSASSGKTKGRRRTGTRRRAASTNGTAKSA